MNQEIENALLEAVWIMRWNKEGTALTAVLETEEALKMCADIVAGLNNAGYEIVKK